MPVAELATKSMQVAKAPGERGADRLTVMAVLLLSTLASVPPLTVPGAAPVVVGVHGHDVVLVQGSKRTARTLVTENPPPLEPLTVMTIGRVAGVLLIATGEKADGELGTTTVKPLTTVKVVAPAYCTHKR